MLSKVSLLTWNVKNTWLLINCWHVSLYCCRNLLFEVWGFNPCVCAHTHTQSKMFMKECQWTEWPVNVHMAEHWLYTCAWIDSYRAHIRYSIQLLYMHCALYTLDVCPPFCCLWMEIKGTESGARGPRCTEPSVGEEEKRLCNETKRQPNGGWGVRWWGQMGARRRNEWHDGGQWNRKMEWQEKGGL